MGIAQLGTFEWNVVDNHVECSSRTREIFGFDDTQGHVADDFFNRIVPADFERVREEIKTAFKTNRRLNTEYRIQLPDGAVRNVVSSSVCHSNLGSAWARHVGVFSDATARKQAEEKLLEGDRRKDEFLAMLAHELRNPLAPITMAAGILSRPGALDIRVAGSETGTCSYVPAKMLHIRGSGGAISFYSARNRETPYRHYSLR